MESARRTADKQAEKEIKKVDIEAIIDWFDQLWLEGELKEVMTEAEYLEFRKTVVESLKEIW
jgi:hypothetical protein